ncbi:hypothetical protein HGRIS_013924 [Hohenbuehelia grisea]|uniref:Uncharacterized protein n=1 Tax=Hohenbuehelia grisea TaxID=104357 RepID=A0ABR3JTH0_9AGAR
MAAYAFLNPFHHHPNPHAQHDSPFSRHGSALVVYLPYSLLIIMDTDELLGEALPVDPQSPLVDWASGSCQRGDCPSPPAVPLLSRHKDISILTLCLGLSSSAVYFKIHREFARPLCVHSRSVRALCCTWHILWHSRVPPMIVEVFSRASASSVRSAAITGAHQQRKICSSALTALQLSRRDWCSSIAQLKTVAVLPVTGVTAMKPYDLVATTRVRVDVVRDTSHKATANVW